MVCSCNKSEKKGDVISCFFCTTKKNAESVTEADFAAYATAGILEYTTTDGRTFKVPLTDEIKDAVEAKRAAFEAGVLLHTNVESRIRAVEHLICPQSKFLTQVLAVDFLLRQQSPKE